MTTQESNEVAGHQYRLTQANRLLRYFAEIGVDFEAALFGREHVDLDPICDADGKIEPEAVDRFAAAM
jgi:hypothetical protein